MALRCGHGTARARPATAPFGAARPQGARSPAGSRPAVMDMPLYFIKSTTVLFFIHTARMRRKPPQPDSEPAPADPRGRGQDSD